MDLLVYLELLLKRAKQKEINMVKNRKQKSTRQFKVSLKSANGNTVAFINFTEQFTKAVLGKTLSDVTLQEILGINNGEATKYLDSLEIVFEDIKDEDPIDASVY